MGRKITKHPLRTALGCGVIAIFFRSNWLFHSSWSRATTTSDATASSPVQHESRRTALCLVIKDEEQYLDEFVDYHSALGFGTIYIYDNTQLNELKQWGHEKNSHPDVAAKIVVQHFPGQAVQSPAYLHCAQRAMAESYTWVAFLDVDEYLVLIKQYKSIDQYLAKHCKSGAISINWVIMGTSGREVYSPQPNTKRFKYSTSNDTSDHIKTIVRLEHMDFQKEPHAHFPYMLHPFKQHTTDGKAIHGHIGPRRAKDKTNALIYHYTYRSYKEYLAKRLFRGRATVNSTDPSHKGLMASARGRNIPRGTFFDDTAWKAMLQFVPKYRYYESLFPDPPPLDLGPKQPKSDLAIQTIQLRPSDTNCAINFHGISRSFAQIALPTIITNVIKPNLPHQCDYFVYYQTVQHEPQSRSGHGGALDPSEIYRLAEAIRRQQGPQAVVEFSNATEADVLQVHASLIQKIRTEKDEHGHSLYQAVDKNDSMYNVNTTINIVKMWHNLQSVWQLMEQYETASGHTYEQVAMFRLDAAYLTPIDIFQFNGVVKDAKQIDGNNTAVIPDFARFPVNDRLIYGPRHVVRAWANRFDYLELHMRQTRPKHPNIGIHSEHFLDKTLFPQLRQSGYNILADPDVCFLRTRAGNIVWTMDCANGLFQTREWMNNAEQIQEKVQTLLRTTCQPNKFFHKLQLQCAPALVH